MLTSSWPNWKNEARLEESLLQDHHHTGEIHNQAMPAESWVFVAAEENIRRTDRLVDDLYPTSHTALVDPLINLSVIRLTSHLHCTSKDGH